MSYIIIVDIVINTVSSLVVSCICDADSTTAHSVSDVVQTHQQQSTSCHTLRCSWVCCWWRSCLFAILGNACITYM